MGASQDADVQDAVHNYLPDVERLSDENGTAAAQAVLSGSAPVRDQGSLATDRPSPVCGDYDQPTQVPRVDETKGADVAEAVGTAPVDACKTEVSEDDINGTNYAPSFAQRLSSGSGAPQSGTPVGVSESEDGQASDVALDAPRPSRNRRRRRKKRDAKPIRSTSELHSRLTSAQPNQRGDGWAVDLVNDAVEGENIDVVLEVARVLKRAKQAISNSPDFDNLEGFQEFARRARSHLFATVRRLKQDA